MFLFRVENHVKVHHTFVRNMSIYILLNTQNNLQMINQPFILCIHEKKKFGLWHFLSWYISFGNDVWSSNIWKMWWKRTAESFFLQYLERFIFHKRTLWYATRNSILKYLICTSYSQSTQVIRFEEINIW